MQPQGTQPHTAHQRQQPSIQPAVPPTPEKLCLEALNSKLEVIVQNAASRLIKELDRKDLTLTIKGVPVQNNGVVAQGFENITGFTQPSLTQQERDARIASLIAEKTRQLLVAPPAIVKDYVAHFNSFGVAIANRPGDPGLSPVEQKKESEKTLALRIASEVERLVKERFEKLGQDRQAQRDRENNARIEEMKKIINTPSDSITSADMDKWIKSSGLYELDTDGAPKYPAEIAKLQQSGILEGDAKSVSPRYFKNIRACMNVSHVVCGAVVAGVVAMGAASAPVLAGILGANFVVQRVLSHFFAQKFDAMLKEIQTELVSAGPMQAGVAWAGAMFKFVKEYNPVWIAPGRTKLLNSHPSTSVDAVLNHLKQAALHGTHAIKNAPSGPTDRYFKDQKFNDYCEQAKQGIADLAKRWKYGQDKQVDLAFWTFGGAATYYGAWLLAAL